MTDSYAWWSRYRTSAQRPVWSTLSTICTSPNCTMLWRVDWIRWPTLWTGSIDRTPGRSSGWWSLGASRRWWPAPWCCERSSCWRPGVCHSCRGWWGRRYRPSLCSLPRPLVNIYLTWWRFLSKLKRSLKKDHQTSTQLSSTPSRTSTTIWRPCEGARA